MPIETYSVRWQLIRALAETYGTEADKLFAHKVGAGGTPEEAIRRFSQLVYQAEYVQGAERMLTETCKNLKLNQRYIRDQARALFRSSLNVTRKGEK